MSSAMTDEAANKSLGCCRRRVRSVEDAVGIEEAGKFGDIGEERGLDIIGFVFCHRGLVRVWQAKINISDRNCLCLGQPSNADWPLDRSPEVSRLTLP